MIKEAKWDHLRMICKNDDACVETFRKVLLEELPKEIQILNQSIESVSLLAAAKIVHKIKHKFALVNMESAYQLSVIYEEELLDSINTKYQIFQEYLDELKVFIGL